MLSKRCGGCGRHVRLLGALLGLAPTIGVTKSTVAADSPAAVGSPRAAAAAIIQVGDRDLQQVLDDAPAGAIIVCDPNRQVTRTAPFTITRPVTLRGLNACLPPKLGNTSLLVVTAKGVTISDFVLTGNGDTASQDERAPLLSIGAGDFHVERGRFVNSSKDGVMIDGDLAGGQDLVGGVVRDIVGEEVIRDTVSISGSSSGESGSLVRNVLVENIRCYRSRKRGAVEVSDGADNITVRKVYAEASIYGVDIQDHDQKRQINRNIVVEDVFALRCNSAVRTKNHPHGHANLTVRDVTARECGMPIQISHTDNLRLGSVLVIDHAGKDPAVSVRNCHGAMIRDIIIENTDHKGPGVLIEDCDGAIIDGVTLRGKGENLSAGLIYRLTQDRHFSGLSIRNVLVPGIADAGIRLEVKDGCGATLTDYIVSGNVAAVQDRIRGQRARVGDNVP